jgi:hypothetical protein
MRLFVTIKERTTADPQERAAMLRHRLQSILYQQRLLLEGHVEYTFRSVLGDTTVLMIDTVSLEAADRLIKADPIWPYAVTTVTPVVSTQAMASEIQDYLGEEVLTPSELAQIEFPRRQIDDDGQYWLAWKEVAAFNPLLSKADQDDVHRRTLTAQRAHLSQLEFADDNPVGKPVGILIARGSEDDVRAHVADCDVFPDTGVDLLQLCSMRKAWDAAVAELRQMRRSVDEVWPFVGGAV